LSIPDYCPFYNPYSNGDCRITANAGVDKTESFCENCRCYDSRAYLTSYQSPSTSSPSCYATKCTSETSLKVKVGKFWYECDKDLEKVQLVGDVAGSVICPYISRMCSENDFDEDWPTFSKVKPDTGYTDDILEITGNSSFVLR
jgi:hypothetical protein